MASSSTDIEPITTEIEIPRHTESNPFNYTEVQKAKRNKAVRDAMKDYPQLPRMWIEMMYDVIENKPVSEVDDIMNNNLWDKPPEKKHDFGGTVKCMEVIDN